jgi:hypothetical protein
MTQRKLTQTKPTKPKRASTFLTNHADEIWERVNQGKSSKDISEYLCEKYDVGNKKCNPKKVTNWIQYRKSAKKGKTFPVSLQNKNLAVNYQDQKNCKNIILLECFCMLIISRA